MTKLSNQQKPIMETQGMIDQIGGIHHWNRENLLDMLIESFKYCQTLSEVDNREIFLKGLVTEAAELVRQEEIERMSFLGKIF